MHRRGASPAKGIISGKHRSQGETTYPDSTSEPPEPWPSLGGERRTIFPFIGLNGGPGDLRANHGAAARASSRLSSLAAPNRAQPEDNAVEVTVISYNGIAATISCPSTKYSKLYPGYSHFLPLCDSFQPSNILALLTAIILETPWKVELFQVLLSQSQRFKALVLLGRFLDMGHWAVDQALSVGILPYVLKLLQTTVMELRQILVFIWTKILSLDKVRAAAVFALGTLIDVSDSFRDGHGGDEDCDGDEKSKAELSIANSLIQVLGDGSPLVRSEVVGM
ncbi:Regulatory-associated protein of TOR 1 [Platanthera zijinensis]|uniref:Regulatory-associated protein of TOR 1 n=1 Tax=Platanthera zijinensis TaxID=2320716 RepID=A0AAP0GBT6_9ASPA